MGSWDGADPSRGSVGALQGSMTPPFPFRIGESWLSMLPRNPGMGNMSGTTPAVRLRIAVGCAMRHTCFNSGVTVLDQGKVSFGQAQ